MVIKIIYDVFDYWETNLEDELNSIYNQLTLKHIDSSI